MKFHENPSCGSRTMWADGQTWREEKSLPVTALLTRLKGSTKMLKSFPVNAMKAEAPKNNDSIRKYYKDPVSKYEAS